MWIRYGKCRSYREEKEYSQPEIKQASPRRELVDPEAES
jgi:hypothetical protein